jgi:hypothetical protein
VHDRRTALQADVGHGASRSITVDIVDDNASALCGEAERRGATDTRSCTGDHRDLAVE